MLRRAVVCVLPLALIATAAMAGSERTPEDMLRGLYAQYGAGAHGRGAHHVDAKALMTPPLARAYAKVTKAAAGDAPPLDWDLFVNAQDYDVQHLNLAVTP